MGIAHRRLSLELINDLGLDHSYAFGAYFRNGKRVGFFGLLVY